jgi:hypothetical protein
MVYKFQDFKNFDLVTLDFINNSISEKEFINYLDSEILNESIIGDVKSFFSSIKEKVLDILYSFLAKSYELGFSIFDKFNTFFNWMISKIKSFKEKHPTLYKIIIMTMIVIIILMVTASSAKAQVSGTPIPKGKIDMAIGWLDYLKSEGKSDTMEVHKAIAHLVDLRDGKVDIPNLGEKAINMADAALKTSQAMIDKAKETNDSNLMKFCVQLMEKGQTYIQAIYSKSAGSENIKLAMK